MIITIEEGITLCRLVQTVAEEHGYEVALTGGVLKHGSSEKDVDIILYQYNTNDGATDPYRFCKLLNAIGFVGEPEDRTHKQYKDEKIVWKHHYGKHIVDLFFLK